MSFVLSHIVIRNKQILLNGVCVYEGLPGSFEDFLMKAFNALNYPKFYKMDNLSRAGVLAADFLLNSFPLQEFEPQEIAMVLSSKSGSSEADNRFQITTNTIASPGLFVYTLPNIVAGEISIKHGIKGESAFFVVERFDVELIVGYAESLFSSSSVKVCIAGFIEVHNESHDIFLYLASKDSNKSDLKHTVENIGAIYYS